MDSCKFKKKITRLVDGELPQQELAVVLRHTEKCAVCRKEYDDLKSLDKMLLDVSSVAPSADFAQKFWNKANAVEQKKTQRPNFQDFFRAWQPALAAAGAVVMIVAGAFVLYQAGSGPTQTGVPEHSELQFVENIDLYSDFEIVNNLELLENWEEIIHLEEI
jgi:anti-sigma factor RsiW